MSFVVVCCRYLPQRCNATQTGVAPAAFLNRKPTNQGQRLSKEVASLQRAFLLFSRFFLPISPLGTSFKHPQHALCGEGAGKHWLAPPWPPVTRGTFSCFDDKATTRGRFSAPILSSFSSSRVPFLSLPRSFDRSYFLFPCFCFSLFLQSLSPHI